MLSTLQWVVVGVVVFVLGMIANGFAYGMIYHVTGKDPLGVLDP